MTATNSSPSKPNKASDSSASNRHSALATAGPQGDASVRPRATDADWPTQTEPPQRHAEAHDDNALETLGKAIIAPIEGAVEVEELPRHSKIPPARPKT